jgi:hypothetical protein
MAKKYAKQVADLSLVAQTANVASQLLFASDHEGFYRITAMIKINGATNSNASVACSTDATVYAPSICSCSNGFAYNVFVIWMANSTNFNIWLNSPNLSYFTSFDFYIVAETFET